MISRVFKKPFNVWRRPDDQPDDPDDDPRGDDPHGGSGRKRRAEPVLGELLEATTGSGEYGVAADAEGDAEIEDLEEASGEHPTTEYSPFSRAPHYDPTSATPSPEVMKVEESSAHEPPVDESPDYEGGNEENAAAESELGDFHPGVFMVSHEHEALDLRERLSCLARRLRALQDEVCHAPGDPGSRG